MPLWGKPKQPQVPSTQHLIKFNEIRDGVVVTNKGELRSIMLVSSINFSLKSEQEQAALVFAYQNFLNSLDFPLQIVMQSKKLDLFHYMKKLKATAGVQTNELLRMQTLDYIDFVERLINIANIMDKKFFVVVPFMPPPKIQPVGVGKAGQQSGVKITMDEFKKYKQELDQRAQVVQSGLGAIGLRTAVLNTQQIIELFYGIYNSEESAKEKLTEVDQLTSQVVASETEKPKEEKGGTR